MTVENNAPRMKRLLYRTTAAAALLAAIASLVACPSRDGKPAGPPEKVTIAYSATTDAVLAQVSQIKGFYLQEGLMVTPRMHPYGKPALEDLLAGKADFATVAETPVMFAIMKGEKISVIATIQSSSLGNAILARKDRGIRTPGELKGKRIAVTPGTTSDYFLDTVLGLHEISRKDVEIVPLNAEAMADALTRGDIDAVSTFTPYTAYTQQKLGDRSVTFQDRNIYRWTFNVVAKQEFIRKNPEKVRKVLRALVRAEEFVRENPETAQKLVADFNGIDRHIVRGVWDNTSFAVSLDQSLILALEDESLWAINGNLTGAAVMPNYLDFIYFDGLRSVKPDAVKILR